MSMLLTLFTILYHSFAKASTTFLIRKQTQPQGAGKALGGLVKGTPKGFWQIVLGRETFEKECTCVRTKRTIIRRRNTFFCGIC